MEIEKLAPSTLVLDILSIRFISIEINATTALFRATTTLRVCSVYIYAKFKIMIVLASREISKMSERFVL